METAICVITVMLIVAYIGIAIYVICSTKTIKSTIGTSIGFICGGFVVIPIAQFIATILLYLVLGCIIIAIIAAIFSNM